MDFWQSLHTWPRKVRGGGGGSWIEEVECSLWSLAADSIGEEVGLYPLPRASHWEWLVANSRAKILLLGHNSSSIILINAFSCNLGSEMDKLHLVSPRAIISHFLMQFYPYLH